ncbi:MAG: hypothetical protein MJZ74_00330 [Muribaculaceae bacterium]|nr:hypothetical protein [Muribaculaceae bacterium]
MKKYFVLLCAAFLTMAASARDVVVEKVNKLKGDCVYKIEKGTYATVSYDIKWPGKYDLIDKEKLQEFIVSNAFGCSGVSVEKALEQYCNKYCQTLNGKLVKNVTKEKVAQMREKRDINDTDKCYPECELTVDCSKWDKKRNVLIMEVSTYINNDNGLQAGEEYRYKKVYFDCTSKRKVEISNLINLKDQDALLQMIKNKLLNEKEVDCVMEDNVKAMDKLPATFDFDDYMVYFRFNKYEVACGMANNVYIGIAIEDIKDMLTPYGTILLMGRNKYKDDGTAAEVKARMQEYIDFYMKNIKEEKYEVLYEKSGFYTKDYVKGEEMCQLQAEKDGEEIGWIEYDTWVDAQEFYNTSFEIKRVLVLNHDEAMVELLVSNCDETKVKRVMWKREGKKMLIDDYSTSGSMMRDMMDKYLAK